VDPQWLMQLASNIERRGTRDCHAILRLFRINKANPISTEQIERKHGMAVRVKGKHPGDRRAVRRNHPAAKASPQAVVTPPNVVRTTSF
jgi:hypothetical protein